MLSHFDRALPDTVAADFALRVRADQLHLLYRQSFPAVYISAIVACIVGYVLWPEIEHSTLLAWVVALCLCSLARFQLFRRYWQRQPKGLEILRWEAPYAVTLFATSSLWGLGMLWFVIQSSQLYRLVEFLFLLGMAAGAFSHYATRRYMVIGAMVTVLLPSSLWLSFSGQRIESSLGLAAVLFVGVLIQAGRAMYRAMTNNLLLAYHLEDARHKAEQLAHTDELTGLRNRRAFMEQAQAQAALCAREGMPLAVLMIDADHFKQINDRHGHAVGDAVLRHVAQLLQSERRQSDVCGRLGGEEFAMLLPNTPHEHALGLAQRLCQACAAQPLQVAEATVPCTVSIGVASHGYALDHLLSQADQALYQAKAAGRNRVVAAPPTP